LMSIFRLGLMRTPMPGAGSPSGNTPAPREIDQEALESSEEMGVLWLAVEHLWPNKVSRTPGPGSSYALGAKILVELNC
jgi:hypothetical protein